MSHPVHSFSFGDHFGYFNFADNYSYSDFGYFSFDDNFADFDFGDNFSK